MLRFILSALLVLSTSAWADADLGRKITVLQGSTHVPRIGIQFSQEPNREHITINFSVWGSELVGQTPAPIAPAFWAIFNIETGEQLTPWEDAHAGSGNVVPNAQRAFSMPIDSAELTARVVPQLAESAIVISFLSQAPRPSVHVDVRALCQSNPDRFVNMDTGAIGCP